MIHRDVYLDRCTITLYRSSFLFNDGHQLSTLMELTRLYSIKEKIDFLASLAKNYAFLKQVSEATGLKVAIDEGFSRAWPSIRDSNVSSLITTVILWWFGTSLIKGFALTLGIGIIISMFSAITITRTFLSLVSSDWLERRQWLLGVRKEKQDV